MNSEQSVYRVRNLRHYYNSHPVLDIPELEIGKSSIVGLMGPNGSGKSTLLRLLGFIDAPCAGEIFYKGKPEKPFSPAVLSQVTLLPQKPYLMKRSVWKNVMYGLRLRKHTENPEQLASGALQRVGLEPSQFGHRHWHELSGGETQRVALAARLALRPEVLLLDEPTASVDAANIQRIREISLQTRAEWGTTIVIASHDLQWLHEVCDQVFHIFKGRIFGSGHESIVFGPWFPGKGNLWEKPVQENQRLAVSKPPHEHSVAVFPRESLRIAIPEEKNRPDGLYRMQGTVSRMTLEKNSGHIITAVRMGSVMLTLPLAESEIRNLHLYPGRAVNLHYDPLAVRWI
ncbi:MAG: energy-coupling factor ABC transporter ATP-binding protein [Desulfococcaceae bacterium]